MGHAKQSSQKGFTLIAALLIMVLLSGVAAGLLYMVFGEVKMGGNDLEAQLAYYGAESGMEKMTSDLGALYQASQSPQASQITGIGSTNNVPTNAMVGSMSYPVYQVNFLSQTGASAAAPAPYQSNITTGSNAGLYALLTNLQLSVTAVRPSGATASMTRTVQVAQVPVFQFGVFCGYDCSYFAGPNFSFGGRVHTNMNLFLAAGSDLVFNDKVQAYKQVIMDQLENGWSTSNGYGGQIYIPSASNGCTLTFPPTGANCVALPGSGTVPGDASWSGGYPTIAGTANSLFPGISQGTFNTYLANSKTGVTNMQLPFVQNSCTSNPPPCTDPISIVRKPLAGELSSSVLGSERLYNKAQIRILLADDPADLHPDWAGTDAQDIQLPYYSAGWNTAPFTNGAVNLTGGVAGGNAAATEAMGFATIPGAGLQASGWIAPYTDAGQTAWLTWPLAGTIVNNPTCATLSAAACPVGNAAPMGPWIRVEYCPVANTSCNAHADFVGVTQEWLNLGFGQVFDTPPTCPANLNGTAGCTNNTVNLNAILILQQLQPGVVPGAATVPATTDWYPINFYDVREAEMRDNNVANLSLSPGAGQAGNGNTFTYSTCSVNGIMNAVELDVGNLTWWLKGKTGLGTGTNVNYSNENGYVLYFSDHRGMKKDPNASNGGQTPGGSTVYSGESGLEDVVNSAQNLTSTAQDGALETPTYYTYSPEDVDQNGLLDNWGEKNLGYGFGRNTNTNPLNSYVRTPAAAPVQTKTGAAATYQTYQDCAAAYNDPKASQPAQPYLTNAGDQMGIANMVTGARHALMLVDGGMSAAGASPLPVMPTAATGCVQNAANPTACGGFTVASENPVYVLGNYNSGTADTFFTGGAQMPHAAASIIADTVTVLSNQWSNAMSLLYPTTMGTTMNSGTLIRESSADAYYRMAVAAGKNIPFPQPTWTNVSKDFGTDGGMHNFLRYLETWNNTLHYNGSLVSMYYSEYNTGVFKCCTVVYSPPTRDFSFDTLFLNPANLPPATPMLQDIVSLSYHQNFTPGQTP